MGSYGMDEWFPIPNVWARSVVDGNLAVFGRTCIKKIMTVDRAHNMCLDEMTDLVLKAR